MNQSFTQPNVATEISEATSLMNTFDVSNDPDKKEINK
jgi:hypothetical protein